jgi:hypothetical protein
MNLSARSYHRIIKLARTIADLEGSENTQKNIFWRHWDTGRRNNTISKINLSGSVKFKNTNEYLRTTGVREYTEITEAH